MRDVQTLFKELLLSTFYFVHMSRRSTLHLKVTLVTGLFIFRNIQKLGVRNLMQSTVENMERKHITMFLK